MLALTGAGSVAKGAANELSAAASGLTGARGAVNKELYFEKQGLLLGPFSPTDLNDLLESGLSGETVLVRLLQKGRPDNNSPERT